MEWKFLEDIVDIEIGKTPARKEPKYWGGTNNWVSISDMKQKFISETKEQITDKAIKESRIKKVPKGSLIMSFKLSIGKRAITTADLYTNEAIAAFYIKNELEITNEFLYYALGYIDLLQYTDKAAKGKTLNKAKLRKVRIPVPPLETQHKIVEVLDQAQSLIDKRKEQIAMMDELVESVFYEMFGDPVKNEKGWDLNELCKVTSKIGSGATPKGGNAAYKEEGISLIRSMNIYDGKFVKNGLAYIDEDQAEKLKNVIINEGDVLINITGASVTRTCIVPNEILPARVNQHVAILRVNDMVESNYLQNLLISKQYKAKLYGIATSSGATREAITKKQLETLEIPVPPIELQNEFARKVEAIEHEKELLNKSLEILEENYNALMQRAFKGELF